MKERLMDTIRKLPEQERKALEAKVLASLEQPRVPPIGMDLSQGFEQILGQPPEISDSSTVKDSLTPELLLHWDGE